MKIWGDSGHSLSLGFLFGWFLGWIYFAAQGKPATGILFGLITGLPGTVVFAIIFKENRNFDDLKDSVLGCLMMLIAASIFIALVIGILNLIGKGY